MCEQNSGAARFSPDIHFSSPNWMPLVGEEATDFLNNCVPASGRENICESAVTILSKGIPPTAQSGQETGLVVGYIQSGKTMSFEAVIALARDNVYKIVIVLAGTSNPLLNQSTGRLSRDLRLDAPNRARRWVLLKNPGDNEVIIQTIRDALDEWRDTATPDEYKKTILITVLKQYRRLQNLTRIISLIGMQGIPALIIDDEADQASLNNEASRGQESTTYRCLMELRSALPNHTYLQYTATPQAPLLINIIDSLSPNFVQVLNPGQSYVGGRDLFTNDLRYIRIIPDAEVPTRDNVVDEPPVTLLSALRVFMVGVTAGIIESQNSGNRSMMVHPSRGRELHQEYIGWVRNIFDNWKRILGLSDNDVDKQELIREFQDAYNDLFLTVGASLRSFDELIGSLLFAFRNTRVVEVNSRSGATPEIDWRSAYGWILVGGQAMDRGFTVEGLTVTYMPRGTGVGNADTIQQRARFFGYKRPYLGYCRIYLETGTLDAFQHYVEHEENIRNQLKAYEAGNRHLNDWKRAFILDTELRPCRNNILDLDYMHDVFSDDWFAPKIPYTSDSISQANRMTVNSFIDILQFVDDDGDDRRTVIERHQVHRGLSLRTALEQLLIGFRVTGSRDSQRITGLLVQLGCALDNNPNEVCTVYRMSPSARRQRGVKRSGEITNLFQGASPVHPIERRGEIYPGDRQIREEDNVTIQIHTIDLTYGGNTIREVPIVAVWVPSRLARGWVSQEERHAEVSPPSDQP